METGKRDHSVELQPHFIVLLLQLVQGGGSGEFLVQQGYEYVQIVGGMDYLVEKGLIRLEEEALVLTARGRKELEHLNRVLRRCDSAAWISPDEKAQCEQLVKDAIYVPKRKEGGSPISLSVRNHGVGESPT